MLANPWGLQKLELYKLYSQATLFISARNALTHELDVALGSFKRILPTDSAIAEAASLPEGSITP